MKTLNSRGFAHFAALAVVVLAVATAGTYQLVASHANSLSPSASCTTTRPLLSKGQTGVCVEYVQKKLGVKVDGIYGENTQTAVEKYQTRKHLTSDGIVGCRTWAQLAGKSTASCKASGVSSRDVVKPKPIDTTKIYCTYRDVDHTIVKKEPMTRTECKAHHGTVSTTPPQISCTYNILKTKTVARGATVRDLTKTTVNSANQAACEKQKYNNEIGVCAAKVGNNIEDQRVTHARCDGYNKKTPGIATWKGAIS